MAWYCDETAAARTQYTGHGVARDGLLLAAVTVPARRESPLAGR
ncbi:hypothetical protein [Streptomyces acidicola]